MRPSMFCALALCALSCSQSKKKQEGEPASGGPAENAPIQAAKKPVPKGALPDLAKDTGGATGKAMWQFGFGGFGSDVPRGVAIAASGDVFVAGYFEGETEFGGAAGKATAVGGSDAYILKLGGDGKPVWAHGLGSKRDDAANAIAVHGDKVVVVGNFLDEIKAGEFAHKASGSDDLFAVEYDKDGNAQWLWTLGGIDSDGANAVASAPDGGWIIGGSYTDSITIGGTTIKSKGQTDGLLVKLAPSGDLEWIKSFGGRYKDTILWVACDPNGNVYVAGHFADTADWGGKPLKAHGGSDNDIVLAKYDTNGDHVWSKNFGNEFNDVAGGLAVDPSGHIVLVGSFENKGAISFGEGDSHESLGEADAYVARFTTDGKLEWAHTFGAERIDVAWGVAVDAAGNSVTTGWFEKAVDFGKGGALASKGNKDVFVVKLDAKGDVVWAQTFGDHDHDQGRGVALDDKGNAVVVAAYRFKLDLIGPPIDNKRPENDPVLSKAPKPDTAVVKFGR